MDGQTEQQINSHKKSILYAIGIILVIAVACLAYWLMFIRGTVFSDDARIDATLVDVSPQVSGILSSVYVSDGDRVTKDQLLFSLDRNLLQAQVEKTRADLASTREAVDIAEALNAKAIHGPQIDEIRIAETAVKEASSGLKLAQANWERVSPLHDEKLVSTAERDRVQTALETARHRYEDASERLAFLKKGTRSEDLTAARSSLDARKADFESAKARLTQAEISLGYSDVRSPLDGVAVRKWKDPGNMVPAGTPVLTLLDPATMHIKANIEEKNLYRISTGDTVDITIDAYPKLRLKGRVDKILRATNSKFSLIPSEGVSGTFIKVAQRVPLKILFNPPADIPLGPGLSVEVRIHCRGGSSADSKQPR